MAFRIEMKDTDRLVASFQGRLIETDGLASANAFASAMGALSMHVVFDIREMSGYEPAARAAWQKMLAPRRKQVLSLTIIGGNAFARLGAIMLASVLGIPHRFADAPA